MSVLRYLGRKRACAVSVLMMTVFLGSCDLAKNQLTYDRSAELDRQDYRDALSPQQMPPESAADIPDFEPVVSTPEELRLPSPLVTVSVNQTVSLRDLMFELAEQAGVDLELDPQIRGSVIFTAKERPFDEVISRICDMSGLRYTFQNHVLRVELDRPYIKNYNLDFLNIARSAAGEISTSISIASGESGGGGEEGSSVATPQSESGSSSSITSSYEGDIWKEVESNLEQILTSSDTHISLATLSDPVGMPVNPMPPPPPPVDPNEPVPPPMAGQAGQMPAAVAPTLNVSSVAGAPLVPSPPATYSISKQTGMVSVFASERQQKIVEKFINEFRRRATTQVLIEAKILQVDLTDEYAAGIDWGSINLTGLVNISPQFASPGLTPAAGAAFTGIFKTGNDLNIAVDAISRFGIVRALSSPRITALNNQPAIVNIARNLIYFSITNDTTSTSTTSGTSTTGGPEATPASVPEGILLSVIPTANPDTGEIFLAVRPTVTKKTGDVEDPSIKLINSALTLENNIPQMQTQEMDSIVRLQSGQMMVMGGLMRDTNSSEEEGIPVMGDIPLFGNLFKRHGDIIEKSELVIFLKATIVGGANADDMDRKVYRDFSLDRRPSRI